MNSFQLLRKILEWQPSWISITQKTFLKVIYPVINIPTYSYSVKIKQVVCVSENKFMKFSQSEIIIGLAAILNL
jgi:hypothetical protein